MPGEPKLRNDAKKLGLPTNVFEFANDLRSVPCSECFTLLIFFPGCHEETVTCYVGENPRW